MRLARTRWGLEVGDTLWMGTVGVGGNGQDPSDHDDHDWRHGWNDTGRNRQAAVTRRYLAAGWIDVPQERSAWGQVA